MENQIHEDQINQIRQSVDIVDIISSYIPLVTKGKNYFGVCPFHDDHSPSMSVSKEKQMYRCFSCGAGGNVFKFIMDYENISFIEALKIVADKGGIPIQINSYSKTENNKNQIYYDIYDIAFKFYQNNINTAYGKEAISYLDKRGFNKDIIKEFGIGLALKKTDMLTKLLSKKEINKNILLKSGLINDGQQGYHDVYYNRIMFPLWDLTGKVIGFSGRIYNSEDSAKYINTKETEIFKKGELLYNYHRAKNEARQLGQVVIMEGFMDVIRAYSVGILNVVATMGTAVTKNQAMIIKRMAKEVILCFDGDDAGAKATIACANELIAVGVTPKIIRLEENLDPDEYIQKYGVEAFKRKINNPINIMDFKFSYLKQKKDLTSNQDMASYANAAIIEISKIDDPILKELSIKKLSEETKLEIDFLKSQLITPEEKIKVPIQENKSEKTNKYKQSEQNLLYYMLNSAEVILLYQKHVTYMPTKEYRNLAREITYFYKNNGYIAVADLMTSLRQDENALKTINTLIGLNLKEEYTIPEIMDYIYTIREFGIKCECKRLKEQLQLEKDQMKKAEIGQQIIELKNRIGDRI